MNPLKALETEKQSVWLDFISRQLLTSGELQTLIERDGLKGMTSNPAIFEKAIGGGADYDEALKQLQATAPQSTIALYEAIAIEDIQHAADALRPVYDETDGYDGYISLEVSPYLALDTAGTIEEGRRFWHRVARPNLMIKVPATPEGIPAIRQLITDGINVNVTLLFAQQAYVDVAHAYLEGLEARAANGYDISKLASVASFFISRIDSAIDGILDKRIAATTDPTEKTKLQGLIGKVAIANAKQTYQRYKQLFSGDRWAKLAGKGARSQRLLWASTGTKNPAFRDVLYVEELIGPDTVNTMPPATMDAFRDHGVVRATIEENLDDADRVMASLEPLGIPLKQVTDKLLKDGVQLFADAADKLLAAVEGKRVKLLGSQLNSLSWKLPETLQKAVDASLEAWRGEGHLRRLWQKDATLWSGKDEAKWLGWLDVVEAGLAHIDELRSLSEELVKDGFKHVLLVGMGGSSLGPEVMAGTFGRIDGHPSLHVLDSTDPSQIKTFEAKIDLAKTLVIVSSKSGGTLEPNILDGYFFERMKAVVGAAAVGRHFVAITDPGSHMQQVAEADQFRHIYYGLPSIGGRYSVLSNFGMVPAAAMGIDVEKFLTATQIMAHSCGATVPPLGNPGVLLGTIMGVAEQQGRNKVTVVASTDLDDFGAWAEQLIAESTGKQGKGLIPVDAEPVGPPSVYGDDRLFVYLTLAGRVDAAQESAIAALEQAGHPVVRITVGDRMQLGQEFFRWEIATAVAGSIIKINPFDQPDVEASKIATRKLTDGYDASGTLPPETPFLTIDGIKLFADPKNAAALGGGSLEDVLRAHLGRLKPGDYAALLAYIPREPATIEVMQQLRLAIRDTKRVATVVGFGPRFLHSTGQAYKGGPNTGVFLQITCDDATDLPVPGHKYSFGTVKAAQARGDLDVLIERGRRALRVHLPSDLQDGLAKLSAALHKVVG
ncbi:MAG TPA: bifunctional transaldolase/phosoglucose isomerase [Stellaceae bacterium]|nr:bifunctional transaldolase/phosoglucose isomerase [Stellaceae bacterium]